MAEDNIQVPTRLLNAQREILVRYDRISNLWVAYHNSGKYPDDFGREFYYAIGKLLQGASVTGLPLYHLDPEEVNPVVEHTKQFERALNGSNGTMTDGKGTTGWQQKSQKKPQRNRTQTQARPNKKRARRPAKPKPGKPA